MIKYLDKGLTPKEVCVNVQMCPNTTLAEGTSQNVSISFRYEDFSMVSTKYNVIRKFSG